MENRQSFLKHFFVIGGGTLINMIVGFLTTPIITRLVGAEEYGQYSIFTMYASIALMVLSMGFDQALIRFFYKENSLDYQRTILRECWILPILLSTVIGIALNVACNIGIIKLEFDNFIVAMLTICFIFQIINRIDLILLRVSYKTRVYSFLQVLYKILFAVLSLLGCIIFKYNFFYILVIATVISYIIVTIIGIAVQKNIWAFWKIKKHYFVDRKELLKYALPFVVSMGITTFFQAIDRISLNIYCSYRDVGIYSSAMTLVHIFAIAQTTFSALWAPMAVEHYEKNSEDREFYRKGNRVISFVMFFIGINLILGKDIFSLLLGKEYREAAYIMPFLCFNPIMLTISETTVIGITFKKKSYMQIIVAAVACIANIIGNTLLVPAYGCRGAAISTGIAYIIFFLMRTAIAGYYYPVKWGMCRFWIITFATVIYAWVNTFYEFGMFSVIGYIIMIILLCVLYKDALRECLALIKKTVQRIIRR